MFDLLKKIKFVNGHDEEEAKSDEVVKQALSSCQAITKKSRNLKRELVKLEKAGDDAITNFVQGI